MFSTANLSIFINLLFFFFFLPLSSLNFKRVFIQRQITLNLSGSYVYGVEYYFIILMYNKETFYYLLKILHQRQT